MQYENMHDEEIIRHINEKNEDAMEYLLKKYSPLVKKEIRTLYLIGADTEDISQEGMIGLFKAIRDYEAEKEVPFYSFAKLCIERQIYTALNASNRKKHSPLNSYVSFYAKEENANMALVDILEASSDFNPETRVIDAESTLRIEHSIQNKLSALEKQVLNLYLKGLSYVEIANALGKETKSVDNAVQRIRNKLSSAL